jgi:predicted RNA-binding protein with PUA-like domain
MKYWLFKSEPDVFSFADLKARGKTGEPWSGVRNYLARNYMRDEMSVGDLGFFYHSSCPEPGIAGILKVSSKPYPDPTQFEVGGEYFDEKATAEHPRWMLVDVQFHKAIPRLLALDEIRSAKGLEDMLILRKGNRLSITPVAEEEFRTVCRLAGVQS